MPLAIVIGGGPAGSLAGLLLARGGFDVRLIEQHRFPRDKVCGECISAVGLDVLARSGLTDGLRALEPVVLTRASIHPGDGPTLDLTLPRVMWGLNRRDMDVALLGAAADAGVVVHQPARCEAIDRAPRLQVSWRDLTSNRIVVAQPDWVIVADGKGALGGRPTQPTTDIGVKAHFEAIDGPRDTIELFAGPGCYGGLAAVNGRRWNAAFSLPRSVIKACRGDLSAAFDRVIRFNPVLAERMRAAHRVTDWFASPLPRFAPPDRLSGRVIPVGNAAAALEPIGGEGMGLALRSAELAASAICAGRPMTDVSRGYRGLWAVRRVACRGAALAASTPLIANAIAPLLHLNPRLPAAVMRMAGKFESTST
jgi:flavin-dependent dehydrogenase